jgi:FkbM family methyltransferase
MMVAGGSSADSFPVNAGELVNRIAARLDPLVGWPRAVRVGADRVYVGTADRALRALSWWIGLGDRAERALLARLVRPGMVAVDIGANIGVYTIELARRVGPNGRVYAIEAEPRNSKLLMRTLAEAGLDSVEVRHVAAADRSGWMPLYVSTLDRGDHRIFPADEERAMTTVRAVTVDDLLADEKRVDFAFIDVCGAEAAVLRGMRRTLARNPSLGILCSISPELLRRGGAGSEMLFAPLRDAGFLPYRLGARRTTPIGESTAWSEATARGRACVYFARP